MIYNKEKFCSQCGATMIEDALFCPKCGKQQYINEDNFQQPPIVSNKIGNINKNWLITLILCILLGNLGVHRFYNGKIITGILMLITIGGFGIWYVVDILLIIFERFTDKYDNYLTIS